MLGPSDPTSRVEWSTISGHFHAPLLGYLGGGGGGGGLSNEGGPPLSKEEEEAARTFPISFLSLYFFSVGLHKKIRSVICSSSNK